MTQNATKIQEKFDLLQTERTKKYDKPHMIIPDEDMAWALEQRSPVHKLWSECWRCDPYGSRWMPLQTSLGKENFKKSKKPLIDAGLFLFENRLTIVDGKRQYEWWVKNLHGCRSIYWKFKGVEIPDSVAAMSLESENIEATVDLVQTTLNDLPAMNSTEVGTHSTTLNQQVGADSTPIQLNSHEIGTDNTDLGINSPDVGTDNPDPGTENTEVGTHSTTQPYLNSLAERVSKSLINSSVTSHKHFINSLKIEERGEFLIFCLKKIKALTAKGFEVRTDDGWIARHYEQYWEEFHNEKQRSLRLSEQETKKAALRDSVRKMHEEFEQQRIEVMRAYQERKRKRDENNSKNPEGGEND